MYCIKCGRDTTDEHVFCDSCLDVMENYPVKSDAAINLPHRDSDQDFRRAPRKRITPPEEQVLHLRKSMRRMKALIATLFLLLCLAGALLVQAQFHYYNEHSNITAVQPDAE